MVWGLTKASTGSYTWVTQTLQCSRLGTEWLSSLKGWSGTGTGCQGRGGATSTSPGSVQKAPGYGTQGHGENGAAG